MIARRITGYDTAVPYGDGDHFGDSSGSNDEVMMNTYGDGHNFGDGRGGNNHFVRSPTSTTICLKEAQ